jgi:hypothetical protein
MMMKRVLIVSSQIETKMGIKVITIISAMLLFLKEAKTNLFHQ